MSKVVTTPPNIKQLETDLDYWKQEFENYSLRLAGVLVVLEGGLAPHPDNPQLAECVRHCPTYKAAWKIRTEVEELRVKLSQAEQRGAEKMKQKIKEALFSEENFEWVTSNFGRHFEAESSRQNWINQIDELEAAAITKDGER